MGDGNGSWGAQNERGRYRQNIPKTADPLSYAKVSERRKSGVLRPAPIQRRPYSTMNRVEPPPGRLPCGANSAIQLTQLNFHGMRYRRDHHL